LVNKRTFKVEGMGCQHCVDAISGALKGLEGVREVLVDLEKGQVDVTYEGEVEEATLVKAIEEAGYQVV